MTLNQVDLAAVAIAYSIVCERREATERTENDLCGLAGYARFRRQAL